jgi:N-acetylmuramoyl-L-alanine amidase
MAGLNLSTKPIVMLESGNMRNGADAARMKDPAFRQTIAQSLVTALRNYLA